MRRVDQARRLRRRARGSGSRSQRRRSAEAACLIEKYVSAPRHIEIQVFADTHGNIIHLGERDCSLQRRHQKVIEETPASGMTRTPARENGRAAVEAARAVGYAGAGTVEFVADSSRGLREDGFWFIEMNTRLQVEHPVTEEVTGLDLVAWQFRVASGERLPLSQSEVRFDGHAVEARVYAEDPENGFLPSTGRIVGLELPGGIRVDSGVEAGGEVSPFYDAMIAKLIAQRRTREAALDRMIGRSTTPWSPGCAAMWRSWRLVRVVRVSPRPFRYRLHRSQSRHARRGAAGIPIAPQPRSASKRLLAKEGAGETAGPMRSARRRTRRGRRATAFSSAGSRSVTVPILIDSESPTRPSLIGKDGITFLVDGAARDRRESVCVDRREVYVVRHGRQTRVRIQDFSAATRPIGRRRRHMRAPMHGKVLGPVRSRRRAGRRRPAPRGNRGDEDGTHASRAVLRAL